jgi:hypothetical protein
MKNKITGNSSTTINNSNNIPLGSTTLINIINQYTIPEHVKTEILEDSIEIFYKEYLMPSGFNIYSLEQQKCFKIIYSCIDGKWNISERIYGKIIPAHDEYFEFD